MGGRCVNYLLFIIIYHVQIKKKNNLTLHLSHRKSKRHCTASCRYKKPSKWKPSVISIGSSALLSLEGYHPLVGRGLGERRWGLLVRLCFLKFSQLSVCDLFVYLIYLGAYSSWFATQSQSQTQTQSSASSTPSSSIGEPNANLLLTVLSYVVSALPDPALSLPAAVALRNLCEANRKELAVHIGAFGELHAGLGGIPVSLVFDFELAMVVWLLVLILVLILFFSF